mmetsp:Transcript_40527/g.97822  ORF Transcript_40527/g.97822 Transcript_40527/m.97822 type:complete len:301 (+) Transcript_40527:117-1019(+)|eukprot:CAMPEP_0113617782 /NCGR_PEP_ID=MMETSP0017_2-20120614/8974_1 /TAXON_ID=2856 /ORGANISM="Cylindrotheca closterium" /LENGTH=300 /DNA_ID=CAMNT_0000527221 /DNA_START=1 /DNA_END=903 /DNA_ORIENTATION=- /assembly_acc=CAM_ASM_000147
MKISALALLCAIQLSDAFLMPQGQSSSRMVLNGYLDDLSEELHAPSNDPDLNTGREETKMADEDKDRYGVGSWDDYVEFDEFDGGDGQMGVAGDGNKKLESFDMSTMAKSKMMSAKNAWGTSSGYADTLIEKGVDSARAQQLENWHNQQEVLKTKNAQKWDVDQYDSNPATKDDENWRQLASFGVERNQEFDLDEEFGQVEVSADLEGTIEITTRMGGAPAIHEFGLKNQFMGFADFRAAFTPETGSEWSIEPTEGALTAKENTNFIVRFRPQGPGLSEGYLVIETEDFKKTWKVVGSTA